MEITREDLLNAKKDLLKQRKENSLVIEGKEPILLTSSLFSDYGLEQNEVRKILTSSPRDYYLNFEKYNYMDAFLFLLHQIYDASIYINYIPMRNNIDNKTLLSSNQISFYNNFRKNNINMIFHFVNTGSKKLNNISIVENASSFYNACLTDFSNKLCEIFDCANIKNTQAFKTNYNELIDNNYKLLEEHKVLSQEFLKENSLKQAIFPRNLELKFNSEDTLDKKIEIFNEFTKYLDQANREFEEKGVVLAFKKK